MISCNLMISFDLLIIKLFNMIFANIPSICHSSSVLLERFRKFKASTCCCVCFSKTCPKGEYVNLACSIIYLQLEGNIALPIRYSYLSILPDNKADIFAASLLILNCNFSSLILLSVLIISFHVLSKRFFLKREGLSGARVVSITKKEYGFAVHFFVKIHKVFKANI